jgi:hypothetical protein
VPAATGGEAEYWFKSPDSYRLADAVILKLKCPAVTDEAHAAIVKMTAEWTQEASKLEEWQGRTTSERWHKQRPVRLQPYNG